MTDVPLYAGFIGTWILDPRTCDYEQGDPPEAGTYRISELDETLVFEIEWVDSDGEKHRVEFSGRPTGEREAFAGGELADALAIEAVSKRELTSYAYYREREIMVAQRQLDDGGRAMRVTQVVRFPDGGHLANVAVYVKRQDN